MHRVIIVCAELPNTAGGTAVRRRERSRPHRALPGSPTSTRLFELHGHIRAVNPGPARPVSQRHTCRRDDSTAHLVLLGGVDWNNATQDVMRLTEVPVTQHSDDDDPEPWLFQGRRGRPGEVCSPHRSKIAETNRILVEDVGHFFRAPNPLNRERTVTVCNGMYSRGVFGAVRALTDKEFRERNADYLAETFGGREAFSLLFRVHISNNVVVTTPDWTAPGSVLHHWSEEPS